VRQLKGFSFLMKAVQAGTLALAVCFSLGATDSSSRLNDLGHRLMCQCGCAQLLGECDHAGCPSREGELNELKAAIAAGKTDQQIKDSFVAKYGAVVLAAPTAHGFDLVAWIAPFAVFGAALLGTILLVRRWANRPEGRTQPAAGPDLATLDPAEQARREKIRRETDTGNDGGF
jgi:cytochrome c-type biogenesis protein CcmH